MGNDENASTSVQKITAVGTAAASTAEQLDPRDLTIRAVSAIMLVVIAFFAVIAI